MSNESQNEPATENQKEKLRFFGCTWDEGITKGQAADALYQCRIQFPDREAEWVKQSLQKEQIQRPSAQIPKWQIEKGERDSHIASVIDGLKTGNPPPLQDFFRPHFVRVPFEEGLKWRGGQGYFFQEKKDGIWAEMYFKNSVLVGEKMRDGTFWAFDVPIFQAEDFRRAQLRERFETLRELSFSFPETIRLVATGNGGEFLEAIIAGGGEGIVAKHSEGYYGMDWTKCTRAETHDCVVKELAGSKASIRLGQLIDGQMIDRGWCACRALYDRIRIGDVVEVECHSITTKGKFRESRLKRLRPDKIIGA